LQERAAVAEQFGRDSHIIMGAVIDESMQQRVEVCVIGMSDMGGRTPARRAVVPVQRAPRAPFVPAAPDAPQSVTVPSAPQTAAQTAAAKAAQDEFGFGEIESRGYFEKTDRNLFDGQDLDVPTYLRKGIRISL
jgi:cell division protein FtsZ